MFYLMTTYTFVPSLGTKYAPPYACLTVGYLEETKLFTNELPKYYNES